MYCIVLYALKFQTTEEMLAVKDDRIQQMTNEVEVNNKLISNFCFTPLKFQTKDELLATKDELLVTKEDLIQQLRNETEVYS